MSKPHVVQHFTHNHPLTEANVVGTYTCNGCKLYGDGKTYRCGECDHDLHEYCATCPTTLRNSWHAPDHELSLIAGPTHMAERGCYVCRAYIQGMFYKCKHCSFESHPHCAHGPILHASSPRASATTVITKQRSLHDHHHHAGQPTSPHHYGQGNPYGYAPYGPYSDHGSGHPHQHPYMNPSSPKADSSKGGKKKSGGFMGALKAVVAVSATVATQVAVAAVTDDYSTV